MKARLISFLLFFTTITSLAQPDSLLLAPWHLVRIDNNNNIYLALENGDLVRFFPESEHEKLIYSPVKKARISLLDVTNPLRPFLFYEDLQEYVILDRFLTESARYSLQPYTNFAGMVAPALNNQIWLVDMVDFSIKKIDPQWEQVQIRIPLPQVLDPELSDFSDLREYQNLLFLVDKSSGIYVFDNLGNILQRLEVPGVENIHFNGNEFYYQVNEFPDQLFKSDIYSGEKSTVTLPVAGRSVFMFDNYYWVFKDNAVLRVE